MAHAIEGADAMVAFVRSPANANKYHIDRDRIVVIGHSMGGYMAAPALAHEPAVDGAVMIGTWDITASARTNATLSGQELVARLAREDETEPADFLPLHGANPHTLAVEIVDHRKDWDLVNYAPAIDSRPVLLLTADDGSDPGSTRFEQALKAAGNGHVRKLYTPTDHGFSDRRIYLESLILDWLSKLPTR